nr:hypothetical protein [Sphingomonas sp.]
MPFDGTVATLSSEVAPAFAVGVRGGWTSADLNYLFHRQQVERSRAASAAPAPARKVHAELARRYEHAIEQVTEGKIRFPSSRVWASVA